MQSSWPNEPSRRLVLGALAALPAFSVPLVANAQAQTTTAQAPVSIGRLFVRCGRRYPTDDVPPVEGGQPDLSKFFVEMFGLVMPEKVAEAVVAKDVKMIFDPVTKDLIKVVMPFTSKTEVMTLTVGKGWVTEASVEDVKLLPRSASNHVPACGAANG